MEKSQKKRYEDLTDRRFGLLTAKEIAPKEDRGYAEWICECNCGNKITVSSKHLKRGTVTNCGCIPKKTAGNGCIAEDLTGKTFGALSVHHRIANRNGRTCWDCVCTCGKHHSATAHDLKAGHVTSCGCGINRAPRFRDLTGVHKGRLIALRPLKARDYKGSVIWECECDCGKMIELSEDQFVHSQTQSCGCLRSENAKKMNEQLHRVNGTTIEQLKELKKARTDSVTQIVGVHLRIGNNYRSKYRVTIGLCGERYNLGTYETIEKAKIVRQEAEKQLFRPIREAYQSWGTHMKTNPAWADQNPFTFQVNRYDTLDYAVTFGALRSEHTSEAALIREDEEADKRF